MVISKLSLILRVERKSGLNFFEILVDRNSTWDVVQELTYRSPGATGCFHLGKYYRVQLIENIYTK